VSKIETGRYSERLRRALGMKGIEIVSGELSPEISPVFVLEDNSIEWKFLQAVRVCGSATLQSGTAGNESLIRWLNPAGSGIMAVFSHFDINTNALVSFNLGYGTAIVALPTLGATAVFDHRWATATSPTSVRVSQTSAGTTISLSSSVFVSRTAADAVYHWDGELVLLPGESLEFGSPGSLSLSLRVNARWTERQLPALEE